MAAAAGKKRTKTLSLFMEAYGLEIKEELSTLATQYCAEGVWTGKWNHEHREAWMKKVREVLTWRQVRGPAGAVMCQTRDFGYQVAASARLDIRRRQKNRHGISVPKRCKEHAVAAGQSRLLEKVGSAKHEYEELKEGIWLERALALLRKKTKERLD